MEASALGALALLETGQDVELARQLLGFLQSKASPYGGWGSTHATVLTLKALSRAASAVRNKDAIRVVVEVNGQALSPIQMPEMKPCRCRSRWISSLAHRSC